MSLDDLRRLSAKRDRNLIASTHPAGQRSKIIALAGVEAYNKALDAGATYYEAREAKWDAQIEADTRIPRSNP